MARSLIVSAMTIGRSHIGATVNTLFLAYVGVGLPLLVLLMVSAQPSAAVLNDELIATEIVRTLIGSLGIVMAIPLTTFIAVPLVDEVTAEADGRPARRSPNRRIIAVAVVIVGLLIATSASTLLSPPRRPLTADTLDPAALGLDPGTSPGVGPSDPGAGPIGSVDPQASQGDLRAHRPGTTRTDHRRRVDRRHCRRVDARAQRRNDAGFLDGLGPSRVSRGRRRRIPSGDWVLGASARRRDGDPTPADRGHRTPCNASSPSGGSLDVALSGQLPDDAQTAFVVYVDKASDAVLYAVTIR